MYASKATILQLCGDHFEIADDEADRAPEALAEIEEELTNRVPTTALEAEKMLATAMNASSSRLPEDHHNRALMLILNVQRFLMKLDFAEASRPSHPAIAA